MKISIVDANYTEDGHLGMSASWLIWEAKKRNVDIVTTENADIVLMTTASQQGVSRVRSEVKKIKRINKTAKIILGGGACYAPAIFDGLVDVCRCFIF
jgi:hypothetical protein